MNLGKQANMPQKLLDAIGAVQTEPCAYTGNTPEGTPIQIDTIKRMSEQVPERRNCVQMTIDLQAVANVNDIERDKGRAAKGRLALASIAFWLSLARRLLAKSTTGSIAVLTVRPPVMISAIIFVPHFLIFRRENLIACLMCIFTFFSSCNIRILPACLRESRVGISVSARGTYRYAPRTDA